MASLARLNEFSGELKKLSERSKNLREEIKPLKASGMKEMWGIQNVYVAAGESGPFWVLAKKETDGKFGEEEQKIFFANLLTAVAAGQIVNPEQCVKALADFRKSRGQRDIALEEKKQPPKYSFKELLAWLEAGPSQGENVKLCSQ